MPESVVPPSPPDDPPPDPGPDLAPDLAPGPAPGARPARGRTRDRRGRGTRGPSALPGPFTPHGLPLPTRRDRFDEQVLAVASWLLSRWPAQLDGVEFAVEEVPTLPTTWSQDAAPLASLVRATPDRPTRVVVFRRAVELRAESPAEAAALVGAVVTEQVSELLGLPPEEVDPRYGGT